MARILVTGARGFVGRHLVKGLLAQGHWVRATARNLAIVAGANETPEYVPLDFESDTAALDIILADIDIVIHLAAHVHVTRAGTRQNRDKFKKINIDGTRRLAESAVRHGVQRIILLSSVGVNGMETRYDSEVVQRFTEQDVPAPANYYAKSKYEAEQVLQAACRDTRTDFVIIRTPLIYGPEVKANFLHLLRAIDYRIPFPLKGVDNLRSLLYVNNLVDVLLLSLDSQTVANKLFLLSDIDIPVTELIDRLTAAMGKKAVFWYCPERIFELGQRLSYFRKITSSMTKSLLVDSSLIRQTLDWTPQAGIEDAISATAKWYLSGGHNKG